MKKKKEIKFPVKKSLIDEDMEIEAFIKQVDDSIDRLDRDFNEFKRQYGANKSFDDWIEYKKE